VQEEVVKRFATHFCSSQRNAKLFLDLVLPDVLREALWTKGKLGIFRTLWRSINQAVGRRFCGLL
jgi:hypothetical protein